jgi:hypothetical protein
VAQVVQVFPAARLKWLFSSRCDHALAYAIDADARSGERGGNFMRKPVLVVTGYFVDTVEARLKQDFELRLGRRRG